MKTKKMTNTLLSVVLVITMLSNFVLEFLFCKFVVYRGQEDTLENKKEN